MFPNLKAEMARFGISSKDLANDLDITRSAVNNKLAGRAPILFDEALKIKNNFFPGIDLEILFSRKAITGNFKEMKINEQFNKNLKSRWTTCSNKQTDS